MRTIKKTKWALVLSGGGAKGFAHIGILNVLAELGVPAPSLVVGTSMGAIVGGLYACGISASELTRFALEEFDVNRYLNSFVFRLTGPVGKVFQAGRILGSLAGRRGVDSGERILALLERLTGGKRFEETDIPFRCNAVDLVNGEQLIFESGSVARAIRASMSFPFVFEPLIEEGRCLVDGGLADNMPVFIARKMGFKRILAVDVGNFSIRSLDEMKNVPQIVLRCFDTALNTMNGMREKADLTIHAVSSATPFSFFRKKELITLGEQAVRENLSVLESFFGRGPVAWLARRRYRDCGIGWEA
ncbi:MAG: patatin-like phospholipase family protein [Treponema sp.]|jgi:NTE family protein|nr:patatin-like phospholipase family protein [Treponema sp.]